ncbi:Crp/Fnr family transcriptional regulator [Paenibacillus sp. CAU 1782]
MKKLEETERITQYLAEFGLNAVLPGGLKERLVLYRFEPEENLCLQGEEAQYIHFIVQGKVKVFTNSAEGKTLLVNFTVPLDVIGEIECLSGKVNLNTVTAVSRVESLALHKRWLNQSDDASFLRFILHLVTQKFYSKSVSLSKNLLHPVEVRLASYLLSLSDEDAAGADGNISMTNVKDAANLIGTSYRHLNRVLQQFCQAGLVERSKKVLIVKDRKRLTDVAGVNIYENGDRRI